VWLWDGIVSIFAERIASKQSFASEIQALEGAVKLKCFKGIG
jgi:hypothetical protein